MNQYSLFPNNDKKSLVWIFFLMLLVWPWHAGAAQNTPEPLTDKKITSAVELEMLVDPIIYSQGIRVDTQKGIVTLSGEVDSLAGKERSEQLTLSVLGVRGVINQLTLEDTDKNDQDIARDVNWKLLNNPATESYEISVSVINGAVTLNGRVDSLPERRLAEKEAKRVEGVTRVDNLIVAAVPSTRPDSEIEADIQQTLRWDRKIDSALVKVDSNAGKVSLSGSVGSGIEREQAMNDSWVAGVREVDASELTVNPYLARQELRLDKYAVKSDEAIKKAVEQVLAQDVRIHSDNIRVEVQANTVSLHGTVNSLAAQRAAVQDSQNTVGVWQVRNFLTLADSAQVADDTLKTKTLRAISIDPYINNFEILSSVDDGIITLNGIVDSYYEKAHAETVVSGLTGVKAVNNQLKVVNFTPLAFDPYLDAWDINTFAWYSTSDLITDKTDRNIAQNIRDQLWWSPFVDADQVSVSVINGTAILTGKVDNWTEWSKANENAYEGGAILVINKLNVADEPNV